MIRFAEIFSDKKIVLALSAQLTWTKFREIIYLDDSLQRDSYAEMCQYMTELPKRKLLEQKLHKAVESARKRLETKPA